MRILSKIKIWFFQISPVGMIGYYSFLIELYSFKKCRASILMISNFGLINPKKYISSDMVCKLSYVIYIGSFTSFKEMFVDF